MTEQYDKAAWRHHRVAEMLQKSGELDDSGYHFGICGENAVKHALRASGAEQGWVNAGRDLRSTPMRKHFPTLRAAVLAVQHEIVAFSSGRHAAAISSLILSPGFQNRFAGWSIDIRYAHTHHVPVGAQSCGQWHSDADELILALI